MKELKLLYKVFLVLWKRRELFDPNNKGYCLCFECDKRLYTASNMFVTSCYSHILAKSEYPQFKYDDWNIKICCTQCHSDYTITPKSAPKQYNEYIKLKKEYELN